MPRRGVPKKPEKLTKAADPMKNASKIKTERKKRKSTKRIISTQVLNTTTISKPLAAGLNESLLLHRLGSCQTARARGAEVSCHYTREVDDLCEV